MGTFGRPSERGVSIFWVRVVRVPVPVPVPDSEKTQKDSRTGTGTGTRTTQNIETIGLRAQRLESAYLGRAASRNIGHDVAVILGTRVLVPGRMGHAQREHARDHREQSAACREASKRWRLYRSISHVARPHDLRSEGRVWISAKTNFLQRCPGPRARRRGRARFLAGSFFREDFGSARVASASYPRALRDGSRSMSAAPRRHGLPDGRPVPPEGLRTTIQPALIDR